MDGSLHVKIPDSSNPNRVQIKDASIHFNVNSIETKPDGLKIYYGREEFSGSTIGDIEFSDGTLIQNSNSKAQLILYINPIDCCCDCCDYV